MSGSNAESQHVKSIRSRIVAFAILATLVPSLGLGLLSFWRYQALVRDNVGVELQTRANYVRSELALWLGERADEVRDLAGGDPLLDVLAGRRAGAGAPREDVVLYLRSVSARMGSLTALTLYDAAGRALASSLSAPPAGTLAAPPALRLPGGAWAQAPDEDPRALPASVRVIVPVTSPEGVPLGALAADVPLAGLAARLRRPSGDAGGESLLLSPGGRPLLATGEPGVDMAPLPLSAEALARLRERPGEPVSYVGHRGEVVVGTLAPAGPWPFELVSERARADVLRAWSALLRAYALLALALALVVGMVAWWFGRSIVRPLEQLVDAAERIGAGDLSIALHTRDRAEIGRLTRVFDDMAARLRESRGQADAANAALQRQNRQLAALSVTDALTGLSNRKRLDELLSEQFALFRRSGRPLTVLMIDIDHFKRLNDTHGHLAGDRVLAHVASLLRRSVRVVDHVARYGGEEFVALLVDASAEGALETAERIRASVEAAELSVDGTPLRVTVSVGVTQSRDEDRGPHDAVARADEALYAAKRGGRNRVVDAVRAATGSQG